MPTRGHTKVKRGQFPYEPRAAFSGAIRLQCPACAHIALYHVKWTTWKIRCKGRYCGWRYVVGLCLYYLPSRTPGRPYLPPRDYTFDSVPSGRYDLQRAHRVAKHTKARRVRKQAKDETGSKDAG